MKTDFRPKHVKDSIFSQVRNEEEQRIKTRMLQLKAGINPHETVIPSYIKISSSRPPAPEELKDHYFDKRNRLRGKQRHIKFTTTKDIKMAKFRSRSTPTSELEENNEPIRTFRTS